MNYHNILHDDMINGDGLRFTLFVSGCGHQCPGCQNPVTWDVSGGIAFDHHAIQELLDGLANDYISGITLSGGDPFFPDNRDMVFKICTTVRSHYPDKTIWCYTGYTIEELLDVPLLREIDVLVDGRYMKELRSPEQPWVGSSNQRVIDVKRTLSEGRVILL